MTAVVNYPAAGGGFGGSGSTVSGASTSARSILTASRTPASEVPSTAPPTVTFGTANANSTVVTSATVSAPTITMVDARIQPVSGGAFIFRNGYYNGRNARTSASTANVLSNKGWGFKFTTDSAKFDFLTVSRADLTGGFRLYVDGVLIDGGTNGDFVNAVDAIQYVLVDFTSVGGAKPGGREIRIHGNVNTKFLGINVTALQTAWQSKRITPQALVLGDSYDVGTNALNICSSFGFRVAQTLGLECIPSGAAGTGFVNAGPTVTLAGRIDDAGYFGAVAIVFLNMGINDWQQTPAAVRAAVTAALIAIRAAQPNAVIIMTNGWYGTAELITGAVATAIAGGFADAGLSDAYLIDNIAQSWITGTGNATTPNGTGNADLYMAADNIHPNPTANAGHDYLGGRLATATVQALVAAYGL